jgi:pantetheine-phosphate adenylyltransferase
MARIGFYPGSFDPVTFGHLDIVARAGRLVDKLVIGVGNHQGKQAMLSAQERVELVLAVTRPIADHTGVKITAVAFDDLAVDAAHREKANIIVRGLRDATDFDYEVQMAQMNGSLAPEIETVFLAASPATRMIASSLVKQIAKMGGDVSFFLPPGSQAALKKALLV